MRRKPSWSTGSHARTALVLTLGKQAVGMSHTCLCRPRYSYSLWSSVLRISVICINYSQPVNTVNISHVIKQQHCIVSEHFTYKVAVLTCLAVTGDVPQYLQQFVRVADVLYHRRLRSSTSDDMIVPAVRLTTISCRAFPVAGSRIWNTLPVHVTSAS